MAQQPLWTVREAHAAYYARMTKADFCDAAFGMAQRLQYHSFEEIKRAIQDQARITREKTGRI